MSSPVGSDRLRALFDEVLGLPAEARPAHLKAACGDDEELRREVEGLLESAQREAPGVREILEALRPADGPSGPASSRAPTEPPTGLVRALADHYRLEREIGRGGMATVYLAEDLRHHRKVAVKVLDRGITAALGADRFLREIDTASNLTHPHILPLHDSGESDGFLYYVMPFVEGESLRARLDRERELPVDEAVSLARELADALAYAHERGVVHRDVKPANILLEAGHAVLADFGVARAVAAADATKLTATGVSLGTPAYMSPEQVTGDHSVDGRSDEYALACVLYEMLAGKPPFTAGRAEAVVHQHLAVEPAPVTDARPNVPDGLVHALRRALAKNPADRFGSTREFAAALRECLQAPDGGRRVMEGASRKVYRQPVLAGAMVGLSVLVGGWAAVSLLSREVGLDARPQQEPRSGLEGVAAELARLPGIAVLPLENRSGLPEDLYFTDGIQDGLLTSLQRISGLRVISRTSVDGYRDAPRPVPVIGQELGVDYLVEGGVQRAGDRVRMNFQLIDARNEGHLWAETYDRALTTAEIFDVQADIIATIARQVGLVLEDEERERNARAVTQDLEAYDLWRRGAAEHLRQVALPTAQARSVDLAAERLLQQAVERDPDFVDALCWLSRVNAYLYQYFGERTEERASSSLAAARRALALDPDSEDAQWVMGHYYYRVEKDYERALEWFGRSARLNGDYYYHTFRGYTERRMGLWREALGSLEASLVVSPRSAARMLSVGETLLSMRRYDGAQEYLQRAIAMGHVGTAPGKLARVGWLRDGSTDLWRQMVARFDLPFDQWELRMVEGDPAGALTMLEGAADAWSGSNIWYPRPLLKAWTLEAMGDSGRAGEAYQNAIGVLEPLTAKAPEDDRYHSSLGMTYAGLGRREDALREAGRGVALMPLERDALDGTRRLFDLAVVHAHLGETAAAVEVLDRLLTVASRFSAAMLRKHYLLRPLWDDPAFLELLEREPGRVF